MKYLVTGGAGFIGSNIVKKLVEQGNDVRVVDNLVTGDFNNINNYKNDIEIVIGDLADYDVAKNVVKDVDYIIHQAAIPSVGRSLEDPVRTNNNAVTATVNLFTAAVKEGNIKRIVQAASSSAYGNTKILPKREDMLPNPRSPYAVAKLAQEYYGSAFYYSFGLEVISLRYFNVFGPNQNEKSVYSAVIPKFVSKILNDDVPAIYGDGETSRDFTYIDNVVEANLLALQSEWTGQSEVINIGAGNRTSLNELVHKINNILDKNIEPVYLPERPGDVKHSLADIEKAKRILGYEPKVDFEQGLKKFIEWYKINKFSKTLD